VKNLAGEVYDVAKVEFDAEKELTKVTLANKEDKSEKVVVLNKEGKEVEDETPAKE
jgi:lipocalin